MEKKFFSYLSAQTPAWPAGGPAFLPPFSLFFSARPAASALRPAHHPSPRGLPRARKSQAQLAPTACHAQAPACSVRRCTPFSPFSRCAAGPTRQPPPSPFLSSPRPSFLSLPINGAAPKEDHRRPHGKRLITAPRSPSLYAAAARL